MRVLIIDGDESPRAHLRKGLQEHGFVVDVADNAALGAQIALDREHAVLIVAEELVDARGRDLVMIMKRRAPRTPIMVMSRVASAEARVLSFADGADDVVDRAISFEELLARIDVLLRRARARRAAPNGSIRAGDLELDRFTCRVRRAGSVLALTLQEYTLLNVLLEHQGTVVSREYLTQQVWHLDFEGSSKVVDVAISRLRTKLDDPYDVKLLRTVRGMGYCLEADDLSADSRIQCDERNGMTGNENTDRRG